MTAICKLVLRTLPPLLLLLLAYSSSGCATGKPVIRLSPRTQEVKWWQGRAIVMKEADGVRVAVAYERNYEARMAFRVEVANDSGQPLLVDPRESSCTYCNRLPLPGEKAARACPTQLRALDPEKETLNAEIARSREAADHANAMAWETGVGLFLVAGNGGGNTATFVGTNAIRSEVSHQAQQTRYGSEVEFWQTATLRRTNLSPGEVASGLVVAPVIPNIPIVRLNIVVGTHHFDFEFSQNTIETDSPNAGRIRRLPNGKFERY